MAKASKAVSVVELRENPAGVVRRVSGSKRPEILRELARGEREIAAGRGFSLEKVLADADKVLARALK